MIALDELSALNVDPQIATTMLTVLPAVTAMRSRSIAEIDNFEVASFGELEGRAIALLQGVMADERVAFQNGSGRHGVKGSP